MHRLLVDFPPYLLGTYGECNRRFRERIRSRKPTASWLTPQPGETWVNAIDNGSQVIGFITTRGYPPGSHLYAGLVGRALNEEMLVKLEDEARFRVALLDGSHTAWFAISVLIGGMWIPVRLNAQEWVREAFRNCIKHVDDARQMVLFSDYAREHWDETWRYWRPALIGSAQRAGLVREKLIEESDKGFDSFVAYLIDTL